MKKIRVGILANEFLDPDLGRLGGFGWAASRAAEVLNNAPGSRYEAVYLSGELHRGNCSITESNGTRLILNSGTWYRDLIPLWWAKIDVLLSIDYRPSYNAVINALPGTPLIVWVRDPKTPDDYSKLDTLRLPGDLSTKPAGLPRVNTKLLARYATGPRFLRRRVFLANKMPHIAVKNADTYGLPASGLLLPNPDVADYSLFGDVPKSEKPGVVYLGRFDPVKRPWVFLELARIFPDTDFIMMGKNHFTGKGGWSPDSIPENVTFTGHLSGEAKYRALASAWVLVNTSIHEESPVSVLEAFAMRTPVVSYEDWGGMVNRFGISVGQSPGNGLDKLPALTGALQTLLEDHALRERLGNEARAWVQEEHNDRKFLDAFTSVCSLAGIG